MRVIKRTFANLSRSTLLLGKAGENLVTRLEVDISRELKEFSNPVFELVLKTPASDDPYPVLIDVAGNTLYYTFTGSDLAQSGNGELEALVCGQNGEVLKSTTAKTKIDPSIIQNEYPGPLQKVIDEIYEIIDEEVAKHGIPVVTVLPETADVNTVLYLSGIGFYRFTTQWERITKDDLESEVNSIRSDIENLNIDVVDGASDLEDGRIGIAMFDDEEGNKGVYVNQTVWQNINDVQDVATLGFTTYSDLVIRDEVSDDSIQDVPVYVYNLVTSAGDFIRLYDGDGNYIALGETQQPLDGMPIRYIKAAFDNTVKIWIPFTEYDYDETVYRPAGWSDENRSSTIAPSFVNFTPVKVEYNGTDYYGDLPYEVKTALNSLSQCINESASAMGHINIPDDAVVRFNGKIEPNRKYFFSTGIDCVFTLPTVDFSKYDEQFVMYIHCAYNVDLSFPADTLFANIPNSDAGYHKLIGSFSRGFGKWEIGGIDYEVQS